MTQCVLLRWSTVSF